MSQQWMEPHYDAVLLLAASAIGVYALYLQSLVVRRVRAHDRDTAFTWLLGGALSVGTAIWAEGLLGLIALKLPLQLGYVRAIVLAAWLPAVVLGAGSIRMYCQPRLAMHMRVMGGLMVSAAVCLLNFIMVSSVVLKPSVQWDPRYVGAAVGVLLLASAAGSVLVRWALEGSLRHARTLAVAALVAILFRAGQMLLIAAVNVPVGAVSVSGDQMSGDYLQLLLTAPVFLLLAVVHLGTVLDDRAMRGQAALKASLQQAQAALEEAAQQDPSTGLFNRQGFEKHLRALLEDQGSEVKSLCVFRLSLDGFKSHVESYGHDMGDAIVRHLAGRLQGLVREGDVLARSDTDEYLLLCKDLSDEHVMAQLAQRLGEAIHEPCLIRDQDVVLSASIGIASFPASNNVDQLLGHSLDAMLTARKAGGGAHCLYERGMDRTGAEQIEMQRDLRHAIARNELTLYFQPKLHAQDKTLAGVEALLRWTHPQRGMVSPVDFIPVAERFGLIGELGLWVLNEACRHIRIWHDAGLNVPVAINLSAHQLRQPDLELRVRDALKRHRVPARMLIMEITESTAMDDIEASLRVFDMLDTIGVRLSIDDFGTGYSSLSYLRRLPARQLKIDRSFVNDLAASLDAQAIVEAVVRLAHALGLEVVAEGVETPEQALILTRLQCDELQGFLYAVPMPEAALLAWLVQHGVQVQNAAPVPVHAGHEEEDWRVWGEQELARSS
ncbi:MAG: EAL domain-containing protein [Aquabacterium sp.]|uniref:putative bifunctional diguanylate cyclase/phosphodiesterase n=1 Tax=Aquabacterium sp. TaxID=1872578 RepID=UPI0025BA4A63|nr:EAL domain-containing protein [Aquabacterium sp.]MBI3380364.1 EAL domain-containing protein [Aquabacterium sp.]